MNIKIYFTFSMVFCLFFGATLETFAQWQVLGQRKFSKGMARFQHMKFTVEDGTPYVIYADDTNNFNLEVVTFDGTDWKDVGTATLPDVPVFYLDITVHNGMIYIAYQDQNFSKKCTVMKFDGVAWTYVGNRGFSVDEARFQSIVVHNGEPYVAFEDLANSRESTVMKFDGSSWVFVGSAGMTDGLTGGQSLYNQLVLDGGTIYLICIGFESTPTGDVNLSLIMKFDGINWVSLGIANEHVSPEQPSLAFHNGTPYVSVMETGSMKTSVKRYDGSNWVLVGPPEFTDDLTPQPQMVMYDGTPYVAYRDFANDQKLTVMFYDGTSWGPLGGFKGVSPGEIFDPEIAIDGDKLYVAFVDTLVNLYNPGRITVMTYDFQPTTTSIAETEISNTDIQVHPNPVSDILTIETEEQIEFVTIFTIDGKSLKAIPTTHKHIDINVLPNGAYILEIKTDKGIRYKRFIKKAV